MLMDNTLHAVLVAVTKFYLKKRKMNQKKLADLVRCSEGHLSHILSGKTPGTLTTWDAILNALKVPGFH